MVHHSRVVLTGVCSSACMFCAGAGAQSQTTRAQHKHVAAHSRTAQPASVASSPTAPASSATRMESAQVSHWQAALFVMEGWLGWGVILYFVFHRRDAAHSVAWEDTSILDCSPSSVLRRIAFWPVTLIYFYGRCWNCHKWGTSRAILPGTLPVLVVRRARAQG